MRPYRTKYRPEWRSAPEAIILGTVLVLSGIAGFIGSIFDDRISGVFEHMAVFAAAIILVVLGVLCLFDLKPASADRSEGK